MERQAYQQDMEQQISEWDRKIEQLHAKARRAEALADRYEAEMEDLFVQRRKVKSRFSDLLDATDDAWDDIRGGFEHAWKDMKRAGEIVVSCFKR